MPVFPDEDSITVVPGSSRPSFSACSIMYLAARSFTDPPGFWPSSLARMRTLGFGLSADTSTSGVLPMRSRIESYTGTGAMLPRVENNRLLGDRAVEDRVGPQHRLRIAQRDDHVVPAG